jgi:N-acetylneuraminic acid mutarotase
MAGHNLLTQNQFRCEEIKVFNLCGYQESPVLVSCLGRLLLFEGYKNNVRDRLRVYEFSREANRWSLVRPKVEGPTLWRMGHAVCPLEANGLVYLFGGMNFFVESMTRKIYGDCFVFDARANSWGMLRLNNNE